MLNVTFAGDIYNSSGVQYSGDDVAYQALFYSDSITKWNDVHYSELGKYNINLGDGDWLTQAGASPSNNDKIIICFWVDKNKNRTDLDLDEWSFIEITINGSDLYQTNAQTKPPQNPQCSFITSENIKLENIGTTNELNWLFNGVDQYQEAERYGEQLFPILDFPSDSVTIDWGDLNVEVYDMLDEYLHSYDDPGDYHVTITVENSDSLTCISEFDVQVDAEVNGGLTWGIPSFMDVQNTFVPNITGDVIQINEVRYDIDGVETYIGLGYDDSFNHTFTTVGPHVVTQKIEVDNIYGTSYVNTDFTIYLDSIANFYKGEGVCGPDFIDNSIVGNGSIQEYYWAIKFENEKIAEYTGDSSWEYTWPHIGVFTVLHTIKDSEGNEFGLERIYDVTECPGGGTGQPEVIGGGGGWTQTEYIEREFPKLKVTKLEELDEQSINISVKTKLL